VKKRPVKCYVLTRGQYSDYQVVAIYRRREDADARAEANNEAPAFLVDGVPTRTEDLPMSISWNRVKANPAREFVDDCQVEEFDYYEGEPTPGAAEVVT